jgi:heme exporter protein A
LSALFDVRLAGRGAWGTFVKLSVEQLAVMRADRLVVDDVSFVVQAGEALVLSGANGAGKTTLLRCLAGLMPRARGLVELHGLTGREGELAEHCHFIGHLNGLKAGLTARENLTFWQRYLGGEVKLSVKAALERFALTALGDVPAGALSAGQKRRLGLARLLVIERPVWLLDEPTVSLDAAAVEMLAQAMTTHVTAGGIVIAATHLPLGLAEPRSLVLRAPMMMAEAAEL